MEVKHTSQSEFFTGVEIEHTPLFGKELLFVVGIHPVDTIIKLANQNWIKGVYLGADCSFNPASLESWKKWDQMVTGLIDANFWVTLDFTVEKAQFVQDKITYATHRKFIPMISVKLAHVEKFNYNTTVKIDDIGFDATNPGVWCWSLRDLMDRDRFTNWDNYANDQIIKDGE
jgi:hypothetical protein